MSKLIIIRGLPGSGKSSRARYLQRCFGYMAIEPDTLLVSDDKYLYTAERYAKAKKISLEMLTLCGLAGADAIYADVLPTLAEVDEVQAAYCAGWAKPSVMVLDMPILSIDESFSRNMHNVRREDIEAMFSSWENYPDGSKNEPK